MEEETRGGGTVTVRVCGRTDLHNFYPESWRKADRPKRPAKRSSPLCTVTRTKDRARRIAEVHATIAKYRNERVYLATHTTAPDWVGMRGPSEVPRHKQINHRRREAFSKFLDRLRKEPGFRGCFWVTELHEGERGKGSNLGTIHHHAVIRFSGFWNWRPLVQQWSWKYCGSSNGLDIADPVPGKQAYRYLMGAWKYLDLDHEAQLPFRWWGTTRIARKWKQAMDETCIFSPVLNGSPSFKARCARVSKATALIGSARVTMMYEQRRNHGSPYAAFLKVNKPKQAKRLRHITWCMKQIERRYLVRSRAFERHKCFRTFVKTRPACQGKNKPTC